MREEILKQIRRESAFPNDFSDDWRRNRELTEFWETPQFVTSDVCGITGATLKAIEHFLIPARGLVDLEGASINPGSGKRRLFTGKHVLMIAAAYTMNRIGFPQKWTRELSALVGVFVIDRALGLSKKTNVGIATFALKNGDWQFVTIFDELPEPPDLPVAFQWLDVDRLIDETYIQLTEILVGEGA